MASPVFGEQPTKTITMSFYDALKEVMEGNIITRIEWENANIYGFMKGGTLHIHAEDGNDHRWIINDGDIAAEDWIVPISQKK